MDASLAFTLSIAFVILGQLLNASTVLIDKYIVTKTSISRPGVYVFYVGIISGFVLILLPFGVVNQPSLHTVLLSLDIGFVFVASVLFLYRALKDANATDVVAWLTAVSVLTTFVFNSLFMHEKLPASFPYAMTLLIIGILFVGHFRFYARSFIQVILAGTLFGLSVVLIKILFSTVSFVDGFFWSRMGNMTAALSLLLFPTIRRHVFQVTKNTTKKTGLLVVANRILGGLAFLSVLYAIRLGSAPIVNALSSLQFLFIFLIIFFLGKYMPELYHHEFRHGHVLHKALSACFIIAGFFVLFI